jgi:hypothetical protein
MRRKPQTVYVFIEFGGSYGDDVTVFRTKEACDAAVLAYLQERWERIRDRYNEGCVVGDSAAPDACPSKIEEIMEFFEYDCYGEDDMRYDTFACLVQD